jgi:predicted nucleic acid-binding protein
LISDFDAILNRCTPSKWTRTLAYRPSINLPFDAAAVPKGTTILLDTTVYVDQLKGDLPPSIIDLIATRPIHHGAPALSELAAAIGYLDPLDARTAANLKPIIETLERVPPQMILVPSNHVWIEASILSGILARTQGVAKADRRRLLNDALLFLTAAETDATLVSRNSKDLDLLLQMKPGVGVLLYVRPRDSVRNR